MSRFLQLHMLTSYPPSNLNRDDLGRPKTAKMGGFERLRVSSQSLKRAWRTSEIFARSANENVGIRTKEMGRKVYARLTEKGIGHKDAMEWSRTIAGVFGKLKELSKKEKERLKEFVPEKRREKELIEVEIEQLAFFDVEEEQAILELTDKVAARREGPTKEELDLLRHTMKSVDIALFGRMLASRPDFNIEAACQVAHALSVHPVAIEDDYFTAVDDLNEGKEDLGAGHIGETGFAAGLFYSYVCINRELLLDNLGGDEELFRRSLRGFTEAAVKIAPSGKQNSFGSRAYASYVLAEKGDQQPRSLSVAFLKPVMDHDNIDFGEAAISALETHYKNMDKVYEICADRRYTINALAGKGALAELLEFVSSCGG